MGCRLICQVAPVVAFTVLPFAVDAADLYRLRFQEPVPPLAPGSETTATVLMDNDDYPFGGGSQRVRGFCFGA